MGEGSGKTPETTGTNEGGKGSAKKHRDFKWLTDRLQQTAAIESGVLVLGVFGALLAQVTYAASSPTGVSPWHTFALTNAIALASVMTGGLVGFLFGVPRYGGGQAHDVLSVAPGKALPNTNLEQISDWLTKIIVGVGLVQMGAIADGAGRLFSSLGAALGTGASASTFAGCLAVFSAGWVLCSAGSAHEPGSLG